MDKEKTHHYNIDWVLDRMKVVSADERFHLAMEFCEDIYNSYDPDNVLFAPKKG